MKKIIFILLAGFLMSTAFAQDVDKKAERKAKKEKEKQEALVKYEKAVKIMKAKSFIITAKTITFRSGQQIFPDEALNFLKVEGENGVLQIAPRTAMNPGFNGLGGITLDGKISNVKERTNEKKNHFSMSFSISGVVGTAQITVNLYGSDQANIMVQGMYSGTSFTMTGVVEPYGDATIFQGTDF